jgi:hypothetical protein
VDARHGVKSLLTASEGYFLDRSNSDEPLRATCRALVHLFQLQLQCHPVTLYHLDGAALASSTALVADRDSAATTIEQMAARLLTAVSHAEAGACVKGRFIDRLDAKLNQLAFPGREETVRCQTCAPATESSGPMLRAARRRLFVTFVLSQNRLIRVGDIMSV